ncbi:MAG: GAF domain-containing protein, partial [bacterium]|nr:GAF domain-containing protein [bacterium]
MQEILIIDEARVIPVEFFRLAKNRLEITSMEKFSIINLEPANEPWVFLLALTGSDDRLYDVAIQIFEVYPKVMSIAIVEREMLPGAMEHGIFNNFVLRPVNPGMLLKTIQNTVQLRLSTESTGYLKRNLEKFTGALGEMGKIEAQLDYYVGKFRMIGELMSCLLSTVPLGELIAKVESLLQQELQCSHLSLLLFSSVNNTLLPAYGQKPTDGELELARKALDAESHVQSGDMENPDKDQSGPGQPVVYIPVRTGGKKLGVLCARGTDSRPPFSESEINILRMISSQVTIALEDSNIYQKIKKATKLLKNKEKDMGSLYDIEKTLRE